MLRETCFDARAHRGRTVRVVVYDRDSGPWGHVLADDLECIRGGRPVACAGAATVK